MSASYLSVSCHRFNMTHYPKLSLTCVEPVIKQLVVLMGIINVESSRGKLMTVFSCEMESS